MMVSLAISYKVDALCLWVYIVIVVIVFIFATIDLHSIKVGGYNSATSSIHASVFFFFTFIFLCLKTNC